MASKVKLKPSNQSLSARGLPVNPPVVKKRITRKKKVANPVRNVNDEDSDKRQSCENGLDRCASLLAAMLESPCGNIPKPIKKKTSYNKRSSTPIDNAENNKSMKLPTAISCMIDSSQVSDTNTIDELIEEKELLQEYLNKIVHRSSQIEKQVKAVTNDDLSDIDKNSDVTHDNVKPLGNTQKTQQKQSKETQANVSENSLNSIQSNFSNNNNISNNDEDGTITIDNDNDTTLTNYNCNKNKNNNKNNSNNNNNKNNSNNNDNKNNNNNNKNNSDTIIKDGNKYNDNENKEKNESDKSELFEILESITSKLRVGDDNHSTDNDGDNYRRNKNNDNHSSSSCNSIDQGAQCNNIKISEDNNHKKSNIDQLKNDNTTDEIQSFSRDRTLTNVETPVYDVGDEKRATPDVCNQSGFENIIQSSSISKNEENIDDPRDVIFKTYRANLPSFLQVTLGKSIEESHNNSNNSPCDNNSNNSRCDGTLLSGNHLVLSSGKPHSQLDQKQKPTSVENPRPLNTHLYENPASSKIHLHPDQTNIQLTTLDYLIKELRSKIVEHWNIELDQLFTEIEHVIGSLSFLFSTISHDTQTDINKVLQPLHVENADLRRKSRFLSEKVEDLNETIVKLRENDSRNVRNEEASVDLIIKTVQEKLGSEQRLKKEMNIELIDLRKVNDALKKENSSLLQSISQKDMKEVEEKEKYLKEKSSKDQEIALLHAHIEELQVHKQTDEKERNILNLSLRQRDYEIDRLSKLNSDLQESVSKLLADISDVKKKQDRQPKYNTAMPMNYVSPIRDNLSPNDHISPTHKYTAEKRVSTGYRTNAPNNRLNPPNSRVLSAHETSLPNVTSSSMEMPSCQKYLENESDSDNLSTIVNNISENSATALSSKSKMSTLSETDFSLWSLATYDGAEFQRNIEHLDAEIKRIQTSIKRSNIIG